MTTKEEIATIRRFLTGANGLPLNEWKEYRGWLVAAVWSPRYRRPFIHAEKKVDLVVRDEQGKIVSVTPKGGYIRLRENLSGEWTEHE